jgi:hypothetical protein
MQAPAVMFIEMAISKLKNQEPSLLECEAKEFNSLGPRRLSEIPRRPQQSARSSEQEAMLAGYLLGLETARVLLSMWPEAVKAGVSI